MYVCMRVCVDVCVCVRPSRRLLDHAVTVLDDYGVMCFCSYSGSCHMHFINTYPHTQMERESERKADTKTRLPKKIIDHIPHIDVVRRECMLEKCPGKYQAGPDGLPVIYNDKNYGIFVG